MKYTTKEKTEVMILKDIMECLSSAHVEGYTLSEGEFNKKGRTAHLLIDLRYER